MVARNSKTKKVKPTKPRCVACECVVPVKVMPPEIPEHDCMEHAVPYKSDGVLGHGWECGLCGAFLQAG